MRAATVREFLAVGVLVAVVVQVAVSVLVEMGVTVTKWVYVQVFVILGIQYARQCVYSNGGGACGVCGSEFGQQRTQLWLRLGDKAWNASSYRCRAPTSRLQ